MEEIKKLLEDCECAGYRCPHEISGKHYVMISEDVDDLINLAVSKERERIVENLKNPYSVVIPTQDGLAEWAILEHGKRMGFERAVKELNTFINTK